MDLHNLHERAQRFVVGVVLAAETARKEDAGPGGLLFTMIDELNKYAPREGSSPIKDVLLDIAERGRSLGIILIGAQQTASEVERRIVSNSAIRVVGRLDSAEAGRPEYGFLPASQRIRATIAKPGAMFVSQPQIPVPLAVEFPFPAWATRLSECAGAAPRPGRARRRACSPGCPPTTTSRRSDPRSAARRRATRAVKFLHTADWHVGKTLKGRDRLDEQKAVLAEIAEIAEANQVDAVLVAGDVYDVVGAVRPGAAARGPDAAADAAGGRRGHRHRGQPRPRADVRGLPAADGRGRHHPGGQVPVTRTRAGSSGSPPARTARTSRWRCCRS